MRSRRVIGVLMLLPMAYGMASAPSVLICDGLAKPAIAALTHGGLRVVERRPSAAELSSGLLAEYDAVIVRSATSLSKEALSAGASGRLRVVGRAGVGVDNIDLTAARASNLWVLNSAGASTTSVVELTLAHLLAASRQLSIADRGMRGGRWLKADLGGFELSGKRLGLVGFGRIAQGVARVCGALGMEVHASSPHADPAAAAALDVTLHADLDDLFRT